MAVLPVKFPERWTQPKPGEILRPRYDLLGNDWFIWSAHNLGVGQTPYLIETRGTVTSVLTYGQRGLFARGFTRAANAGINHGIRDEWTMAETGLTIAAVAKPSASADRKTAISQRYGSNPWNEHRLGFNIDETAQASSGALTLFSRNTSGTEVGVKALNGVDGNWHGFVAGNSSTASSGYIYRDGQALSLTTNTSLTGTYNGSPPSVVVGNLGQYTTNGTYVMDEPMVLVIGWRRQLNASLAALISKMLIEDPYSVFEEYRPLFFFPVDAGVTGTAAFTNANDTLSSSGTTTVVGTLARTNSNDTLSSSGTTTIVGTLSKTNTNDTLAASGSPVLVGTASFTNANDTLSASGSVGGAITGTAAFTNANDTLAANGTTTIVGSLSKTNNDDTLSASGNVSIVGTLAYTNNNDTLSASGTSGTPSSVSARLPLTGVGS